MQVLDLFCGAGGASAGYAYVCGGENVAGVDLQPQRNYPFSFYQADAMAMPVSLLSRFDLIHASPPCQAFSVATKRSGRPETWPDYLDALRANLEASGALWCIENVVGAPLRNPVLLCGTMFPGLRVIRHRLFETNFPLPQLVHGKHPLCHTHDRRKHHFGKTDEWRDFVQVTGGGNCSLASARDAMGIGWQVSNLEINQALPPAYTRYIAIHAVHALAKKKLAHRG